MHDDPRLTPSLRPHSLSSDPDAYQSIHRYFADACSLNVPQAYGPLMSTKHIRTIADLVRFGAGLRIECVGCGAARTLDGYEAAQIGGASRLSVLEGRLRCARCGSKEARVMILPPV